jgi:hypothetical protein
MVTNTNDSGLGSLRQAILDANSSSTPATINFNIASSGVQTIALDSALPAVTNTVTIDGATEGGFSGSPLIVIDGSKVPAGNDGLDISGSNSTVRSLAIINFQGINNTQGGIGLLIQTGFGSTITGNYLGTNATGTKAAGNLHGLEIDSSPDNIIGGTKAGDGNLISGNGSTGLRITGSESTSNTIEGNLIGTDITGKNSLVNLLGGMSITDGSRNTIGGKTATARNVISGNEGIGSSGIFLMNSSGNTIQGNYVGVDLTGEAALGNPYDGILIQGGSGNLIGGTDPGDGNVLSANDEAGIGFNDSQNNVVQGNLIGTDATGTHALGNGFGGVSLGVGSANNVIGGSQLVDGANPARNVIADNGFDNGPGPGVYLSDSGTDHNLIEGNLIGTDITGTVALGNQLAGVLIYSGPQSNTIGGLDAAGNVIAGTHGNSTGTFGDGVIIRNASNNTVEGNLIGTTDPTSPVLGNHGSGVLLMNADSNMLGGTIPGAGNTIAGNKGAGVRISSLVVPPVLDQIMVQPGAGLSPGTYYYVVTATTALGETTPSSEESAEVTAQQGQVQLSWGGSQPDATGYKIYRGTAPGQENVIVATITNGSTDTFVDTGGPTTPGTPPATNTASVGDVRLNQVLGNLIGTFGDGVKAVPNAQGGVLIQYGTRNTIGTPSGPNTIRFNDGDGVSVAGSNYNGISGNSIASNSDLGIHLTAGANNNQAAPVLGTATLTAGGTVVTGTISGAPNSTFTLELFGSPSSAMLGGAVPLPMAQTPAQGMTFLSSTQVATDGTGSGRFSVTVPTLVPVGQVVTATVTDALNNTSPFSNGVAVIPTRVIAVAAGPGGGPEVKVFNAQTQTVLMDFFAYNPAFTGGVRVAVGDVTGDGIPDIVTAPGPGGGSDVHIYDGATGALVRQFFAFNAGFSGGVYLAVGAVANDGAGDIICGADAGGGPNVAIYSGTGAPLLSFFPFNPAFTGGVRVAAGDVLGNGQVQVICGAGPGGGPQVVVADGTGAAVRSFFAYDPNFSGGTYVAAGNLNGSGPETIITGPDQGGGPNVAGFDASTANVSQLFNFMAYANDFTGGVRVAAGTLSGGRANIITGPGPGTQPLVETFDGLTQQQVDSFFAFNPLFAGGVYVAGT